MPFFYLRKKSRHGRRRKESVKLPELGGEGGGLANSGNARIETFFLFCTRPLETSGHIDRTPGTPGSDKNKDQLVKMIFVALAAFHTYPS